MGWLIALAVIVLLAILPLGVSAKYEAGGPIVLLIAGPARMTLFPVKKKGKAQKKDKKEEKTKSGPSKAKTEKPGKQGGMSGGKLTDFLPLVQVALELMGDFRRKLRVDRLEMKIIMAGDDPCDLATNYGKAWAAMGNLWPALERLFVIKKRDVQVECDFTADQTLIYARLDLTITLGRLVSLAVRYGFRAVKELLKIMKSRKGGAEL